MKAKMTETTPNSDKEFQFMKSVLEKIRSRLLDKTRRNRLLNYKESARDTAIINEMPDQVFEHLVMNDGIFYFDPYLDPDNEEDQKNPPFGTSSTTADVSSETDTSLKSFKSENDPPNRALPESAHREEGVDPRYTDNRLQTPFPEKELERRLRKLFLDHRTIIEETGANNLYLAIGFLQWYDKREEAPSLRSPLILLPVRLEKDRGFGPAVYKLVFDDEALDTNYSLYERLIHDYDISLPLLQDEQTPEAYWKEVQSAITPRLEEGWSVIREMTLGLFRFHKQVMWHDLDPERWPKYSQLLDKATLKRILLGPQEGDTAPGQLTHEYAQDDTDNNKGVLPQFPLIYNTDSSQYTALVDALTREDGLVIEGPPGTGKSQTITNLIAAALDLGLSVLFVAEKMAALDVVYKNLEKVGLGVFCLQLHGLKTSKKELLQSITKRSERRERTPEYIEQQKQELQHTKNELIELSIALSEVVGPEELPLYKAAWRVERLRQQLPDGYTPAEISNAEGIKLDAFHNTKYLLNDLGKEWTAIPSEAREAWHGFLPKQYEETQQAIISTSIRTLGGAIDDISSWLVAHQSQQLAPSMFEVLRLLRLAELDVNKALPPVPLGMDLRLAHTIAHKGLVSAFQEILEMLQEYFKVVASVNEVFDYQSEHAGVYAKKLQHHVGELSDVVCGDDVTVADLSREKQQLDTVIQYLESLPKVSAPVVQLTNQFARTVDDYKSIAKQAKQLAAGPAELSLNANPFHVKATIKNYLNKALEQNNVLARRASEELGLFHPERVEDTESLRTAYETIEVNKDRWFVILSRDYRNARNLIRRFIKKPKLYSRKQEFLEQLRRLVAFCEQRDQFANNDDYRSALGSLFKGVESDWKALHNVIDFSHKLRDSVGKDNAIAILSDWDEHVEVMESIASRLTNNIEFIERYAAAHSFPPMLWQRPSNEIARTLLPWAEKLQAAIDAIIQPWCNTTATLEDAIGAVNNYDLAKEKERQIRAHEYFDTLLHSHWSEATTPLSNLLALNEWLQERLKTQGINLEILRWVFPEPGVYRNEYFSELLTKAKKFLHEVAQQVNTMKQYGEVGLTRWIGGDTGVLNSFKSKLGVCLETLSSLPLMVRWQIVHQQVCEKGLARLANAVASGELIGNQCGVAFEYAIYSKLLDAKISSNTKLSAFGHTRYENLRDRFAKLDKKMLQANAQLIASRLCKARVPEGVGYGTVKNYTEKRLLLHEAGKKRRHIPIRQLIRRSSNALQALKPCFLMSPLSVAQYLAPGEIGFDLVVMDEASQIRPEDALGAIIRGKKIIVVGDPKQLPPTSYFDAAAPEDEEAEESIVDETESILDVCLKQFPFRRLRWHYRSQHESLIQFSNQSFYDGDLIVFPSPKGDSREFGVHSTFVETSSYRSGRNRMEAEVVVENIIHHYRRHKDKSLGVAAFNKRQAEEIQLLLDRARSDDPAIDELILQHETEEPLFIKNLENVQGDERDVIFISTTYGAEKPGAKPFQRFGPINSELGWRRLNVIATRAKQRVEVFTSMRPTDIQIGQNARRGVRAFRDYLEYAATGRITEHGAPTGKGPDSEFEVAVTKVLNDIGYETDPQVGVAGFFIDIGVEHPDRPGEYLMGIECDGAAYHSSRSVRDRDRLRQEILETKGWFIHRIWSTSWFHTRSAEIDRLKRVLKGRLEEERNIYTDLANERKEPEVLEKVHHATREEIALEEQETSVSLEVALRRFWEKNITSQFPNPENSILSDKMIRMLVAGRPETEDQWFKVIPMELRECMDPQQRDFLDDILDVIAEYV